MTGNLNNILNVRFQEMDNCHLLGVQGVSVPVWFSSHPDPGGRAESIREQMKTVLPGDLLPPEIDWDLVRSALEQ